MPLIELQTHIDAPVDRVFNLSRSIDLHQDSTSKTHEKAIAGKVKGLIELGESVTWRARHLGVYQKLTVEITDYERPHYFVDEMVKGAFHSFRHEHSFQEVSEGTLMIDRFQYRSPLGILGKLVDQLFLKNYMESFLKERNAIIKEVAESNNWQQYLPVIRS